VLKRGKSDSPKTPGNAKVGKRHRVDARAEEIWGPREGGNEAIFACESREEVPGIAKTGFFGERIADRSRRRDGQAGRRVGHRKQAVIESESARVWEGPMRRPFPSSQRPSAASIATVHKAPLVARSMRPRQNFRPERKGKGVYDGSRGATRMEVANPMRTRRSWTRTPVPGYVSDERTRRRSSLRARLMTDDTDDDAPGQGGG
jgi:hypothetical protein